MNIIAIMFGVANTAAAIPKLTKPKLNLDQRIIHQH